MGIFKTNATVADLNALAPNTIAEQLGIQFSVVAEDRLEATMPVDNRTHQPMGLLHGGASVVLAETLGSVAAMLCIDMNSQYPVGLEINANHIRGVKDGVITGVARPIHIGKKTQVWDIRIFTEAADLVCISRITIAILDKKV